MFDIKNRWIFPERKISQIQTLKKKKKSFPIFGLKKATKIFNFFYKKIIEVQGGR
jgi:hypothetical protein